MLILLTQHKHNRPAAVNSDHIVWIDEAAEARANVYLSSGTLLQVKESVAQIADMVGMTVQPGEVTALPEVQAAWLTDDLPVGDPVAGVPLQTVAPATDADAAAARANAAAEHAAQQSKPGKHRETK
jgi:hypothetical protein